MTVLATVGPLGYLAGIGLAVGVFPALFMYWQSQERKIPGSLLRIILALLTISTTMTAICYRVAPVEYKILRNLGSLAVPPVLLMGAIVLVFNVGPRRVTAPSWWLLGFATAQIVSLIINGQLTSLPLDKTMGMLYLPCLVLIGGLTRASPQEIYSAVHKNLLAILYSSLALVLLAPKIATLELPRRWPILGLTDRVAGVTPHPNLLAFAAALSAVLSYRLPSRWKLLHILAAFVCIGLAEARNVAATLTVTLIVMWGISGRSPWGRIAIASPLIVASMMEFILDFNTTISDNQSLAAGASTFNNRTVVWSTALKYIPEKPLLGWGPFAFDQSLTTPFSHIRVPFSSSEYFPNAHNQFVQAIIDAGIIGLFLLLGYLLSTARAAQVEGRNGVRLGVWLISASFMVTEVPLTAHIYGYNFVVAVLSYLIFLTCPGIDSSEERLRENLRARNKSINPKGRG